MEGVGSKFHGENSGTGYLLLRYTEGPNDELYIYVPRCRLTSLQEVERRLRCETVQRMGHPVIKLGKAAPGRRDIIAPVHLCISMFCRPSCSIP
jgi:hypothetical protein